MDTLIIKLEKGHQIRKSIGRIFRQYNVVEYKSPPDYVSINDFFKVMGYACIFQANTERVLERPPEEITVTFAANRYPRKLMKFLQDRYQVRVEQVANGIYYMYGLMFAAQLVLIPELTKEEYVWLSRLREDLQTEDVDCLSKAYVGRNRDPLYEAAMDLIIKANREVYEEARDMCEAIRELFADEFAKLEEELARKEQELARQEQEFARQEQELIAQLTKEKESQGVSALIETCRELGLSRDAALAKVIEKFDLEPKRAQEYVEKVWKEE